MKKYFVQIENCNGQSAVEISANNNAAVDSRNFEYDFRFISSNVLCLRINNKNYLITISENSDDSSYSVLIDSQNYRVSCKSELDIMIDKFSGNKKDSRVKKQIHSPMPGIIKSLNVKEGQSVSKGDVLLVLEAMKMENEIKAAIEGKVKKVNVSEMNSVEKNELLVEFE